MKNINQRDQLSNRFIPAVLFNLALLNVLSIFFRDFAENFDDKVYLYAVGVEDKEEKLSEIYARNNLNGIYYENRINYLSNYPFQSLFVRVLSKLLLTGPPTLSEIFLIAGLSMLFQSIIAIIIVGTYFFAKKRQGILNNEIQFIISFLLLSAVLSFFADKVRILFQSESSPIYQALRRFSCCGGNSQNLNIDLIGRFLGGGLDLGIIGSTPRGVSLLMILFMWIALRNSELNWAAIFLFTSILTHVSYGTVGVLLWWLLQLLQEENSKISKQIKIITVVSIIVNIFLANPNSSTFIIFLGFFVIIFLILRSLLLKNFKFNDIFRSNVLIIMVWLYLDICLATLFGRFILSDSEKFIGSYINKDQIWFVGEYLNRIGIILAPILSYEILKTLEAKLKCAIRIISGFLYIATFALLTYLVVQDNFYHSSLDKIGTSSEIREHPYVIISQLE